MLHFSKLNDLMEKKGADGEPAPFSFKYIKKNGEIITADDCIRTSSFYDGRTSNIKWPNGEIRKLKNICFIEFNGVEVFA